MPDKEIEADFIDSDGFLRDQYVMISLNKDYDPIEINPYSNFQIKGRVLN